MAPTVITEEGDVALAAVERFGQAVLKPLFSTKARGMEVVEWDEGARARVEVPFDDFGRNAIQAAKQIVVQRVREAEREQIAPMTLR